MHRDGLSHEQVARVLSRTHGSVKRRWMQLRPPSPIDTARQGQGKVKLSPNSLCRIEGYREGGLSWPAIFAQDSYGYSRAETLAKGFERALKRRETRLRRESEYASRQESGMQPE